MVKHMTDEINFGSFDCPEVKCGFIGEIGCCYPLYGNFSKFCHFLEKYHLRCISILEFEKKAIVASAMAQEATGAPVSFHPGRDPDAPFEIMRIFAEAGGNTKKSICSHLESMYICVSSHRLTLAHVGSHHTPGKNKLCRKMSSG